jgi:putative transposase
MPEHVHLVLWPTNSRYSTSDFLNSIKQSVSKRVLLFVQREARTFLARMEDRQPNGTMHYRFWQRGGGYDRNVDNPECTQRQIGYIHSNPVRRGLCVKAEDYNWSSAADHAGLRTGPLRIDRESLPGLLIAEM